jgi:hypothetical protein
MHRAAYVLLACCGSTGTPPPSSSPAATETIANKGPGYLSFRSLRVIDTKSYELELEELTIDGTRMSLVLVGRTTSMHDADGSATTIDGWQDVITYPITGAAERTSTGFVLDYTDPVTVCTEQWVDAAPANATVIVRDCAWSLGTERVKVLGCKVENFMKPYSPPPGIERVKTDHCKRPMYRRVRADGSVAPALAR